MFRRAVATRERLLHLLAEAAEFEHNLLCCYLYAAFSLKRAPGDWSDPAHAAAIARWHAVIMSVALEEMTHLALVANLAVSVGAHPHFNRPNLPVAPGYHPAGIVVELAPFDVHTLDHFIFLERPDGVDVADGQGFEPALHYARGAQRGAGLMPAASDYETIAQFYDAVRQAFTDLSQRLGDAALFVGDTGLQLDPRHAALPGLIVVRDLASALQAIDTIVIQGEGAGADCTDSHYARFCAIQAEYRSILEREPGFVPARPVARNPVMREPAAGEARVHVDGAAAAPILDLANALFNQVLRLLAHAYGVPHAADGFKRSLVEASLALMRVFSATCEYLATLPAGGASPGVNAGVSFTVLRATEPFVAPAQRASVAERFAELAAGMRDVCEAVDVLRPSLASVEAMAARFAPVAPHPSGSHAGPAGV